MELKYLILVECEIWPSLIYFAKKNGAKVIIINGRVNMGMGFIKRILIRMVSKYVDYIFPAGLKNRENFIAIGFPEEKIGFTENLKYDFEPSIKESIKYRFKKDVVVFGSIREGEEKIVVSNIPDNAISVSAPRHLNRVDNIIKVLKERNIKYSLYSSGKYSDEDVLIIDKMGVLIDFYRIADIVFIGGTIMNYGGHNPIEAAYFEKPILAGRYTSSIDDFFEDCIKKGGCMRVNNDFKNDIEILLKDKKRISEMGKNAKKTIEKMKGSKDLIISYIKRY